MRPRGNAAEFEERRKKAVELVEKDGKPQSEVARQLGVTPAAVSTWLRWHRGKGTRGLAARPTSGRPPSLKVKQAEKLRKKLLAGAKTCGFSNELWTCPRIRTLIQRDFGVSYHMNHLPKLLRRLGFSPQRPTRRAVERDEAATRGWIKRQWPRIKKKPST